MLVCGKRLAEEVHKLLIEKGTDDLASLLEEVNAGYEGPLAPRDPEELLFI